MLLTEKAAKAVKYVAYGIEIAFLAVFIILCVAVTAKNKTIKAQKNTIKAQIETIDSLRFRCDQLWAEDAITINVQCNLQQKGVVNLNQTNQIARTVATITRGEVIAAIDSITRANNEQ